MVNIAPHLSAVSDRSARFFSPDGARMRELHEEIIGPLSDIGRVLVVGGLIRDLAFYGADERPVSDIDFVVTGSADKLQRLAAGLGAEPNRFGGFGLSKSSYRIDFWSMNRTWAKVNNIVSVKTPKDLVKTTFFNWDGIVYDLSDRDIYALPKYMDFLHSGLLDINLRENPSEIGNLVRALRRLVMWDAKPGRSLNKFMEQIIYQNRWSDIVEIEKKAFNISYLSQFCSSTDFRRRVICDRSNFVSGIDKWRQRVFEF